MSAPIDPDAVDGVMQKLIEASSEEAIVILDGGLTVRCRVLNPESPLAKLLARAGIGGEAE